MEVTSPAWTQCGTLHNPPKSVFFIIILKFGGTLNYDFKELHLFSHRKRPTINAPVELPPPIAHFPLPTPVL